MRKLFGDKKIEYPCPSWVPDRIEDIDKVYDRLAAYTNQTRHFVVYKYGTGVYPEKTICDPIECDNLLLSAVKNPPDFNVTPMKDGNFLVGFHGPVYGIVLGRFYRDNKDGIKRNVVPGGLLPGEKLIKPDSDYSIPEDHYYIGLYARAKLYADAATTNIALVYEAAIGGK